jgi:hypothetical protein
MYDEVSDIEPRASTEMNSFAVEVACYQAKTGKDQTANAETQRGKLLSL